jgi:hypothetical protein
MVKFKSKSTKKASTNRRHAVRPIGWIILGRGRLSKSRGGPKPESTVHWPAFIILNTLGATPAVVQTLKIMTQTFFERENLRNLA